MKLCIDIGHNKSGFDIGARGINNIKEEEILLNIGAILKSLFSQNEKVDVLFTRTEENPNCVNTSVNDSLTDRINKSNKFNADYFISLHCNSFVNSEVQGIEIFHYSTNTETKRLATNLCGTISEQMNIKNRGAKTGDKFRVIKEVNAKAILIELGFITNQHDYNQLTLNQNLFAYTLYNAICSELNINSNVLDWETTAINWAVNMGVSDGTRPYENATRIEIMQMFKNFYQLIKK